MNNKLTPESLQELKDEHTQRKLEIKEFIKNSKEWKELEKMRLANRNLQKKIVLYNMRLKKKESK